MPHCLELFWLLYYHMYHFSFCTQAVYPHGQDVFYHYDGLGDDDYTEMVSIQAEL